MSDQNTNQAKFITLNVIPPIDKVGFQIRKDGSLFSDVKTGSIPQIDAIIKTNDDRIYKTTQNLNSTYTDADGNTTITKNAAEPLGASMSEVFLKEYVTRFNSDKDYEYGITYDGNKFITCGLYTFSYSKDGSSWNNCNIPDDCTDNVFTSIAYGNNKYCAVSAATISNNTSNVFLYSTDGITWQKTTTETSQCWQSVCYGNGKFVAVGYKYDDSNQKSLPSNIAAYSLDGITWAEVTIPNRVWQSVCYGNSKFVATTEDTTIAYSTNGTTWTEVTIPNTYYASSISFIHNKFILISKYDGTVSESSDGISWTNLEQDYSRITNLIDNLKTKGIENPNIGGSCTSGYYQDIQMPMPIVFMTKLIEYNSETAIGYFMHFDLNKVMTGNEDGPGIYFIIAKSNDLKSWYPAYTLDKYLTPMNIICNKDRIITIGATLIDAESQYALIKEIQYKWSTSGNTIKLNEDKILPILQRTNTFDSDNTSFPVDTTYSAGDTDPHEDQNGGYVFSGWDKTGKITLTPESEFRTVVSGIWEWKNFYRYSYSWNASDYSDLAGSVTLPSSDYVATGSKVTVDKNYTSDSIIGIKSWTQGTMPSSKFWQSVCYDNDKFVAISGAGHNSSRAFAYSSDGITWTQGTMPSSQEWQSVCYGNDKFVAVASSSNVFAYSSDGINWTQGTMPSSKFWISVCYGNGKFVAIANGSSVFAYSSDGITWTEGTMPSNMWCSVCYGNGKFVAVGYASSNIFAYSSDGINWTEGTMPSSSDAWQSVCYGNGKFVAIAEHTNIFAYSSDGINWTEGTMPSSKYWQSVCYGNGKFVAIAGSSNIFAYSSDGINWTQGTIPSQFWQSVCYGNDKFVAIAGPSNKFAYLPISTYYSFSGWDKSDFNITENTTISGIWSKKNKLKVTYSWTDAPNDLIATIPETGYYMPNEKVYVDKTYTDKIGKKDNSIVWTQGTMPSSQEWQSVCYGNGKFVAISGAGNNSSNVFTYSSDGINWTKGTMPSSQFWLSVCYGNNKFVAVANNSDVFAYSSDGINWTKGTMPSSQFWISVCYGNGKYVAVTTNRTSSSDVFAYSSDGITWTQGTMPSKAYWFPVCYGNDKFVAITFNSNVFAYSNDGIKWTQGTMPSTLNWKSICYGNGKFVTIAFNSNIFAYSSDGITWTQGTMPNSQEWESICYGNGKFVAIAKDINKFIYSTDGITWTQGALPSSQFWISVCYGNDKFIAVVNDSNVFAYSSNSKFYYQFSGWNKSDFNITENTTISSTWNKKNKYAWNYKTADLDQSWSAVAYNGSVFAAVKSNSNIAAYSYDGLNWTQTSLPKTQYWSSITVLNGSFICSGADSSHSSNIYASSSDGITWIQETAVRSGTQYNIVSNGNDMLLAFTINSKTYNFKSGVTWDNYSTLPYVANSPACYGNGKYLVFSSEGLAGYAMYSTDGENWNSSPVSASGWSGPPIAVTYGNGKFVCISNGYRIFYSTDGINWTQANTDKSFDEIYYGNNIFIAKYSSGNTVAYSFDGIDWNDSPVIKFLNTDGDEYEIQDSLYNLCYGNNKWIALVNTLGGNMNYYSYMDIPSDITLIE